MDYTDSKLQNKEQKHKGSTGFSGVCVGWVMSEHEQTVSIEKSGVVFCFAFIILL